MAGTEDVAEKVADILFEQTARAINMATGTAPKIVQGVGSVTSLALSQLIDEVKHNKELRRLMNLEGEISFAEMKEVLHKFGSKSSSVMVGDSDAKDYETLLKDQGVLYAKLDKQDDNCKMFVFLNRDTDKVENATTILKAQRGQVTELRSDLYFNSLAPDKIHMTEGLSAVEMELFRHYAREENLLFTVIPKKDNYMVICDQKDIKKSRRAMLHVGWSLTGPDGSRVRKQVEHRLAGRSAIQISAEEGEKELYIVSGIRPSQYVKISSADYTLYKQNKKVSTVSRSDPDFFIKCLASCEALAHPVVLSPSQFRNDLTSKDLESAHTIDLLPQDFDDMMEMEKVNRLVDLVAQKSGIDDEHNATWGIWDPSVSYSEFSTYEYIHDEEEREARKYEFEHFKQAAYYSQDHHKAYDIDMYEKNVDYIIAKAEEKQKAMAGKEPAHSGIDYDWNRFIPSEKAEDNGRYQ